MTSEQADRIALGWSHEQLARLSNVSAASVYLLERMGTAGPQDDLRIRNALTEGKLHLFGSERPDAQQDAPAYADGVPAGRAE